jgi:hypothetical protein
VAGGFAGPAAQGLASIRARAKRPQKAGLTGVLLGHRAAKVEKLPKTLKRHRIQFHKGSSANSSHALVDSIRKCECCYKYKEHIRTEAA